MSRNTIIAFAVVVALLAGAVALAEYQKTSTQTPLVSAVGTGGTPLETKSDDQGQVTIDVTPLDTRSGEWRFKVALTTHSVELDEDMVIVSVLRDESGRETSALAWEGSPPGGHHREGVLVFDAPASASSIQLIIKSVGDIAERTFRWDIQ